MDLISPPGVAPGLTCASGNVVVSIVMSMRDGAATVSLAVRSLLAQTLTDWELILIDDGSRDDGVARVVALNDPRIRIVGHDRSEGLPKRLNQAVALARGKFIARMDVDDVCYPERLARQIGLLESRPDLDLVSCGAIVFHGDGRAVGCFRVETDHSRIIARSGSGFYFPHPTWCGRAEWFRQNPYDERMLKAQDQELLLRSMATSCFGAVEGILLGYRQERIQLAKVLMGRRLFAGALWRAGKRNQQRLSAISAITVQMMKGAIDTLTIGLGLHKMILWRRYRPPTADECSTWMETWAELAGNERDDQSCAE
jgi:hypothetical protein